MKLFLTTLVLFASNTALACPVCFSAKGGTLGAFRWSTAFLSLIPLIAILSFVFWYFKKAKHNGSELQ